MSSAAGATGSGEKLATVSYFPGVFPPSSEQTPITDRGVDLPDTSQIVESLSRAAELIIAENPLSEEQAPTPGERSARAHNISMHALARRGVSSAEMATLLKAREIDPADVEIEVARLEAVGLLDDRDLAHNLVHTLRDRKGFGRGAIVSELRRRKIESSAIESALDLLEDDEEVSRALAVAVKRAGQLRSLDHETARRRLGAFLMRRGYSGSVVTSAVAAALSGEKSGNRGPRFE